MSRSKVLSVGVVALVVGLGACKPHLAPVYAVSTPLGQAGVSPDPVRAAVLEGLRVKGWRVTSEAPGVVTATVLGGGHSATVRIDYNPAGYAIGYLDSSPGLRFDGTRIHRRYNHWIRLLDEAIQARFAVGAPAVPVAPTVVPPSGGDPAVPAGAATPAPGSATEAAPSAAPTPGSRP